MPDGSTVVSCVGFVVLILLSAYFSAGEMALSSINKIHMITAADNGDKRAKRVLSLLDSFEKTLTVLLIGNNLVNIGCATMATVLATRLAGRMDGMGETQAVLSATVLTTIVVILFGEMIPKTYAKACNERYARRASFSLQGLSILLWPAQVVFTAFGRLLAGPFLKNAVSEPTVTEDELADMVESITEPESQFDADTAELVQSALAFGDRTVKDVMIPRRDVFCVTTGMKTAQVVEALKQVSHSRVPVLGRDGTVKGILRMRQFFKAYLKNRKSVVLAGVMDRPFYLDDSMLLDDALRQLSSHKRNLALVRDQQETWLGIVTVEDILETLVGRICDEDESGGSAT